MGNGEEGKSLKPEKQASPANSAPDQTNIHVYPDWAAMQAYYGPRVAVPPYFNPAVASGHSPHPYMWGPPQPMMPPYGAPYAAMYAHGGVYAHPGVPLGSHSHGHGVPTSPAVSEFMVATPLSMDTPAKSTGNMDRGLMKKLKEFDGLAMSIGNGNADSTEGETDHGFSQSGETEGSGDGSDGNTVRVGKNCKKRSFDGIPNAAGDRKTQKQSSPVPVGVANGASKVMGITVASASVVGKVMGTAISPSKTTTLELRNLPIANAKMSTTGVPQSSPMIPNEAWPHNEREVKREKRKQSNRESARRSRLRKQAEAEELAKKVESINAENLTIKSEINRLTENSEKLKLENATLMDKLNSARGQLVDSTSKLPVGTENLLARVNNSGSIDRNDEEGEMYEKKSGAKLRQLLDASPRTDAVAAG